MRTSLCNTTNKVRFATKLDAMIALSKRKRRDKGEQRLYHCRTCRGWHLTSMTKQDDP